MVYDIRSKRMIRGVLLCNNGYWTREQAAVGGEQVYSRTYLGPDASLFGGTKHATYKAHREGVCKFRLRDVICRYIATVSPKEI